MDEIRCVDCGCVSVPERSKPTKNNAHLEKPRGYCYCTHEGAKATFMLRSNYGGGCKHGVGICWSVGASDTPSIKTAPVWCPRKLMYHPLLTSADRIRKVVETRMPHGLMWAYDGQSGKFIGVDNRTGEAWVEEFDRKRQCLEWLKGKTDEEVQ